MAMSRSTQVEKWGSSPLTSWKRFKPARRCLLARDIPLPHSGQAQRRRLGRKEEKHQYCCGAEEWEDTQSQVPLGRD